MVLAPAAATCQSLRSAAVSYANIAEAGYGTIGWCDYARKVRRWMRPHAQHSGGFRLNGRTPQKFRFYFVDAEVSRGT
jgi:hypothetical protein